MWFKLELSLNLNFQSAKLSDSVETVDSEIFPNVERERFKASAYLQELQFKPDSISRVNLKGWRDSGRQR